MKILLQHGRTGLYLCESGDWTREPEEALNFEHTQRVIDHVRQTGIRGVHISVKFHDGEFDEVFPIPPSGSRPAVVAA
jgi:hypothetical protein